jgi:hypothetical protein
MAYDYPPLLAVDPATNTPVASANFAFYPVGATPTPGQELPVTDLNGVAILQVTSTAYGVVPPVRQADQPMMLAVSGSYQTTVVSVQSLVDQATASAADAADSATAATAAADYAAQMAESSAIPSGATDGQSLMWLQGHIGWGTPSLDANQVGFTPTGQITADNVQAAIVQAATSGGGGDQIIRSTDTSSTATAYTVTDDTLPDISPGFTMVIIPTINAGNANVTLRVNGTQGAISRPLSNDSASLTNSYIANIIRANTPVTVQWNATAWVVINYPKVNTADLVGIAPPTTAAALAGMAGSTIVVNASGNNYVLGNKVIQFTIPANATNGQTVGTMPSDYTKTVKIGGVSHALVTPDTEARYRPIPSLAAGAAIEIEVSDDRSVALYYSDAVSFPDDLSNVIIEYI